MSLETNALCTVSDIKRALSDVSMSTEYDSLLIHFINAFSAAVETFTGRKLALASRTEYFDASSIGGPGGGTRSVQLKAYPVATSPALQIWDDPDRNFDSTTLLVANTDYVLNAELGIVQRMSSSWFNLGFDDRSGARGMYSAINADVFKAGYQSIKVTYTGGFVTARSAGPSAPTLATNGAGDLSGTFRWLITRTPSGGDESCESDSTPLVCSSNTARVTFANPGSGYTTKIYRTKVGLVSPFYYVASVAGSGAGGNQTYDDNIADASLGTTTAPDAGPLVAPFDLREVAIKQVVEWFNKREDPSKQSVSTTGQGNVVYGRAPKDLLPFVKSVIDRYEIGAGIV